MEWQDEHVHAALQASGLRATASRLRILYALAHHEDPVTAQALHAELRAGGSPVGLTTVYRALAALLLVGEVHTFRNADELAYRRCGPAPTTTCAAAAADGSPNCAPPSSASSATSTRTGRSCWPTSRSRSSAIAGAAPEVARSVQGGSRRHDRCEAHWAQGGWQRLARGPARPSARCGRSPAARRWQVVPATPQRR